MGRNKAVRLSPSVICEGYWRRKDPFTGCDISSTYYLSARDWYGVSNHRVDIILADGQSVTMKGTYRSYRCLKLAVKADGRTPNGTMMCNQCARVPTLQSFVSMVSREEEATQQPSRTPNKHLNLTSTRQKLTLLASTIRILRQKSRRQMERKRTIAAKEALERSDVRKFTKELQFIAQRGTLEDKRIMWSYLKDVVHNEFLISKSISEKASHGMRWSSDTKDFASSQKLMAGKRYVHFNTLAICFVTPQLTLFFVPDFLNICEIISVGQQEARSCGISRKSATGSTQVSLLMFIKLCAIH